MSFLKNIYQVSILSVTVFSFCAGSLNAQSVKDDKDVKTIFQKDQSAYQPKKIRAGAFQINPQLSLEEKYDSNIYRTNSDTTGDYVTMIKPAIDVRSNWNRNSLNFYGNADIALYSDRDNEDYEDYNVGTNGELEIFRKNFISGGIDFSNKHEDRGSPDAFSSALTPTEYDVFSTKLGFDRKLHKIALKLNSDYKNMNYYDSATSSGTILDNDRRDRKVYDNSARLSYAFIPNYQMFIDGGYNVRRYDLASTVNRDSDGFQLTAGTSLNISGKAKGEIFVGYLGQNYEDGSLTNIKEVAFGANLLWNVSQLTSLTAGINRSVEETVIADTSGYVSTAYNLSVEHELLRNLLTGLNVSFSNNDYRSNVIKARKDDIATIKAEIKYLINRNLSAKLNYQYEKRESNIANQGYTKNNILIGLTIGF